MFDILWICLTYCIGSVPFGLVFAKTFCRIDPRTAGSGNVGATNVARLCGKAWGAATLACDLLKGTIPVFIAMQYSTSELVWTLTALAAILGHLYSCFLGFKGGKAVATSIGVLIPLAFWQLLIAVCICLFLIWRSGFVSLGSLALVTAMPILLALSGKFGLLPLSLIILALVFWSHRENIRRLAKGEERRGLRSNRYGEPGEGRNLSGERLPPFPRPPSLHLPRPLTDGEAARREFVPATGRESIVATKK